MLLAIGALVAGSVAGSCALRATAPRPVTVVVSTPVVAPKADAASAVTAAASWERSADDAGVVWTRRAGGPVAPPLVLRGVVEPTQVDELATCEPMRGARRGAPPVRLEIEGAPRALHVFVRARGPVGIAATGGDGDGEKETCAVARPNAWARLDLDRVAGEVALSIADVDLPGERRGQTSPWVLVVRDDEAAAPPDEEPEARAPLGPKDVVVRWALVPMKCPEGMEYWTCSRATIELDGAERRRVPLKRPLMGQSGCWPSGAGVHCGGASGSSDLSVAIAPDGTMRVSEYAQSDGYCPPPDDCGSTTVLATAVLKAGERLVPDPAGTFPPAP